MTVWFVTSGTSVMRSACWGVEPHQATQSQMDRWLAPLAAAREEAPDRVTEEARRLVESHLRDDCMCEEQSRKLPAEVATMVHLLNAVEHGDRVILAHGTGRQELMGHVLLVLLRELLEGRGATVELAGPYSWDPSDSDGFNAAIAAMWQDIQGLWHGPSMCFVFTGGYKAIGMCLAERVLRRGRLTHIYYLHEEQSQVIDIAFRERGQPAIVLPAGF